MTEPGIEGGAAAPEAKPNPFAMMLGALFAPGDTFGAVARRPVWVVPLIIYVLFSIAGTVLVMPKIDFESAVRAQMEKQGQEIDDKTLDMIIGIQKPVVYVSSVVMIPIAILIIAAVHMAGFRAFGGVGTFGQFFSVTTLAWMPLLVQSLIGQIVIFTRKSISVEQIQTAVMSNLGFLTSPIDNPARFALLSSIDLFSIWVVALLIVGFAIVSKLPRAQAIGIVVVFWLIYVIGKTGIAAIGQMMQPGGGGGA
ncbi:MAG: YIP1 family protein [Acidobacteria bacterium]|nr:YIP1 family protein [Acidobacteriota bacterium]